jgi:hypothetical protein
MIAKTDAYSRNNNFDFGDDGDPLLNFFAGRIKDAREEYKLPTPETNV